MWSRISPIGLASESAFGVGSMLMRYAHEQRIVEIAAQSRQIFAQRRLGDVKHLGCPRKTMLTQQHVEHPQMLEIEFSRITIRNVIYIH